MYVCALYYVITSDSFVFNRFNKVVCYLVFVCL